MDGDGAECGEGLRVTGPEAFFDGFGSLRGLRILEVGCGSGSNLQLALDRGAIVWGVDPSVDLLRLARRQLPNAELRVGIVEDLPFDSGMFDVVCWFGALEGKTGPAEAVGELARVCRAGGVVAIFVDGTDPAGGCRRIAELRMLVEHAGLRLQRCDAAVISVKPDGGRSD